MSKDLRTFLQVVREAGAEYYAEVKKPLKPELEVGIIQHKLASENRIPAIYCPQIEGSTLPLVLTTLGMSYLVVTEVFMMMWISSILLEVEGVLG